MYHVEFFRADHIDTQMIDLADFHTDIEIEVVRAVLSFLDCDPQLFAHVYKNGDFVKEITVH